MKQVLGAWSPAEFGGAVDPVEYLRVVTGFDGVQDPNVRQGLTGAINWACDLLQAGESAASVRARIRIGDATTLLNVHGVHLLSAHIGKGQQFDWVIVLGLEQGSMPFFKADTVEANAEEARVLAVMMSRARHGLILTHAASVETLAGNQRAQEPSIFLSDVATAQGLLAHASAVSWIKNADWEALAER
jgi:DNA helicase-2/ATP-dependent DNA helicase PcrA